MDEPPIIVRQTGEGVAVVVLNRPDALNALNTAMGEALLEAWSGLAADPGVRAVVMTGEGRAFCTGADLKERNGMTDAAWAAQHLVFERMIRAQLSVPVPIVAAVHGAVMGGGAEMALACDFTLASTGARFAMPEVKLGIMPGLGGPAMLVRAIGERAALELLTTGRQVEAQEALALGLVSRVVTPDVLFEEAMKLATQIAANAPLSVRALKRVVRAGSTLPLEAAMELELDEYNRLFVTADRHEGVGAFNERRTPQFKGA